MNIYFTVPVRPLHPGVRIFVLPVSRFVLLAGQLSAELLQEERMFYLSFFVFQFSKYFSITIKAVFL
jgi:hypothetical protein